MPVPLNFTFDNVTVSAAQDLFEIPIPADKVFVLTGIKVSQSSDAGDAQSEQFRVTVQRVTGAPTSGSGGSTVTSKAGPAQVAAGSITAELNNTTQLSGGTSETMHSESSNVMAGFVFQPTNDQLIEFPGQSKCVISLPAAPADPLSMSGKVEGLLYG